jgi:uracil-DNA glycosylase family 4
MKAILKQKQKQLDQIAKQIQKCKLCKQGTVGLPVPGQGNPNAEIVFIGEAPGKNEAKTGLPFIGRAGAMLTKGLESIGLERKDVYITSPVKYLPKQGTPSPKQIAHGKTHMNAQLEIIDPKIIVLMGRVAALAVLDKDLKMTQEHGKTLKQDSKTYFYMLHPAAPLHSPKLRQEFFADFKKLKKHLKTAKMSK